MANVFTTTPLTVSSTPFVNEEAEGLLLKATRDCQAVRKIMTQCSTLRSTDLPFPLIGATVAVSAAAQAVSRTAAIPTLTYDNVDDFVSAGDPAESVIVGRASCWKNSDVMLRLHYAMQAFRYASMYKNTQLTNVLRRTDAWQTVRMGLVVYFDLLRIGMTGKRVSDMASLVGQAGAIGVGFSAVAVGGAGPDTVVPANGLGVLQGLVAAIESAYGLIRQIRQAMTGRLPQPPIVRAQHSSPFIHRACFPCNAGSTSGGGGSGSGGPGSVGTPPVPLFPTNTFNN